SRDWSSDVCSSDLLQIGDIIHLAVAGGRGTVGRTMHPVSAGQGEPEGIDGLHRGPVQEVAAPQTLAQAGLADRGGESRTAVAGCGLPDGIEVAIFLDDVEMVGVTKR